LAKFGAKDPEIYNSILVRGFSKFLALYSLDSSSFIARTQAEAKYLADKWDIFAAFYLENTVFFEASEELDLSLSLLMTKSRNKVYFNGEVIKYFQNRFDAVELLLKLIFQENVALET
jgi:hypothetical protein